ncbi:MAG TPA: hypothetical protein VG188_03685 [Solirubrobacteraceae bacterium]|jgi:hypothetical protein|nr:hypothetical protein [Solirubrobacteraceae bacterium]
MQHRFGRGRGPAAALLIASLFLSLAFSSLAPASPLRHDGRYRGAGPATLSRSTDVVAEYKGTITENFESPPPKTSLSSDVRKAELSWDETVAGPLTQIQSGAIHWHVNSLTGAVTDKQTEADGKPLGCEGRFSPTSTDGGERGVYGPPLGSGGYSVRPPYGLPAQLVSSTGPASGADTNCDTEHWDATIGDTAWEDAVLFAPEEPAVGAAWSDTVRPSVEFPSGGGHTQSLPFSFVCAPPNCGTGSEYKDGVTRKFGSVTVTVASSITFSSPGLSSGSPKAGKTAPRSPEGKPPAPVTCPPGSKPTCPDKKLAQEDLKGLLANLANQCAIAALGSGLLVTGLAAPESGVAVVLAAAGPTGAEVFALSGPACAILIKRAYDDAKIIEDPPVGALNTLAWPQRAAAAASPLPPCTPYAGASAGFCKTLRRDAARYLAALGAGQALEGALVPTVDRITGATRARNRSALRRQSTHAAILRRRLRSASAKQRTAGRAIAALIGSQGLTMKLTATQQQVGVTRALSGLHRRGISASRLTQLTGIRLTAAPSDLLNDL